MYIPNDGIILTSPRGQALAPHKRKEILTAIANDLREKRSSFESALVIEAGKTITDASVEVNRAIDTVRVVV